MYQTRMADGDLQPRCQCCCPACRLLWHLHTGVTRWDLVQHLHHLGRHGQMQLVAAAVALVDRAVQMGRGPEPAYVRVGWDQAKLQILTGLEEPSAAVVMQVGRCSDSRSCVSVAGHRLPAQSSPVLHGKGLACSGSLQLLAPAAKQAQPPQTAACPCRTFLCGAAVTS